jgi:hypothetical protein
VTSASRRPWIWLLSGVALALLIALVAVAAITRTDWGRGQVLELTLTALGGRLNGVLEVDRLEGNVLTGARLYDITLTDAESVPLLQADSAYLEYDLPTFLGGDVVINRLVLYDPELLLVRLPTDTLWNYQKILQDTSQQTGGAARRATLIEQLRLVSADVTVRLPWEPDESLSPAAQRRELREALMDTSRLVVDSVAGGYLRTMVFEVDEARLSSLSVAPDERGGTSLVVDTAAGRAFIYREPALRFLHVKGELGLRDGIMRYRAPIIVLPDSRAESVGVVDVTGDDPAYDLALTVEAAALADLQWLFPTLPDEGVAEGQLWIETRPEGLMILVRDLQVAAPETRIRGDFGMVFGDTLRFLETELVADPLDVPTIERLLPAGLPVEGLRIGAVEIGSGTS